MSASKKRKERQTTDLSNATEKQRRDRQEAQSAAAKTKLYWGIGVITAVLIVALLVWNSGIFQRNSAAATVNGEEYSVAEMSYYYGNVLNSVVSMQSQYSNLYSQMGMTFTPFFDTTVAPADQVITDEVASSLMGMGITGMEVGQTFEDFFHAQALNGLQNDIALCNAAADAGYTLSQEGQDTIVSTIESYKSYATNMNYSYASYLKANFGSYMTQSVFEDCIATAVLASEYQTTMVESYSYSDEDYTAYYEENAAMMDTYDYRMAFISGAAATETDEDGAVIPATEEETQAAMDAASTAADDMVAAIEAGASFNEAAAQYVAESSKSLYEDEEYNHITTSLGSTIAASSYGNWLTDGDHTAGDLTIVEDTTGYYVVQFFGRALNETALYSSEIRHILVKAEVDEAPEGEVAAPTDAQMDAAKARAEEIQAEFEATSQTADDFATLADTYSEDPGSNGSNAENGGASGGYYEVTTASNFFADFQNWALSDERQVGDLGLIKNAQSGQEGYHLMYFQAPGLPAWKNTADSALRGEAYTLWYDELLAATPVAAVDAGMNLVG